MNQGLALAVEAPFHKVSTVAEILRVLSPPVRRDPVYVGEVRTARGTLETRFMHQGQEILADRPTRETTTQLTIDLTSRAGQKIPYILTLPLEILTSVRGSTLFVNEQTERQRRVASMLERLREYAVRLYENPDIDPDFAKFVRDNDIVLSPPTVDVKIDATQTPVLLVDDLLPQEHEVNMHVAYRYFIKIALLHAAASLGVEVLQNPIAEKLRRFLREFMVPGELALGPEGDVWPLFCDGQAGGTRIYWWRNNPSGSAMALAEAQGIPPETLDRLRAANILRAKEGCDVARFVQIHKPGHVLPDFRAQPDNHRFHRLTLIHPSPARPLQGTSCRVELFGGLFDFEVQISMNPLKLPDQPATRIELELS
jgi:hypothetical protein